MPTLAEIRIQYPQYKDMSDDDLEDKLYRKFYSDMPRAEFYKRMATQGVTSEIQKGQTVSGTVPVKSGVESEYDEQNRSVATTLGNIPGNLAEVATGAAESGRTGADIGLPKLLQPAAGVLNTLAHPQEIYDTLKKRYGNGLQDALEKQPVAVISDALSLAFGLRGGLRGGGGAAPKPEFTPAAAKATAELKGQFAADQVTPPSAVAPTTSGVQFDRTTVGSGRPIGNYEVIDVDPQALMRAHGETDPTMASYEKLDSVRKFTENKSLSMPEVGVENGRLGFTNGRNRAKLAAISGLDNIPIAVDKGNAAAVKTLLDKYGARVPMDVGGENILGTVERLANTSVAAPEMREFLTERQKGSLDRISTDLASFTGTKRTALQATQQVMQARKVASSPAYKVAFEAGDREIWSQESPTGNSLERLSGSPDVQDAMHAAITKWQTRAIADKYGAMNPTQVERGGILKFGGRVPVFPNLQFWDYTKGALGKMIDGEIRQDGTMTRHGQALTQISNDLTAELDRLEPAYKNARAQWAGPSEYLGALRDGADILTKGESAEQMRANFNSLSEASKQGYRESAVSVILNKLQSNPAARGLADLTRELKSPQMRDKIAALMTPEAAAKWNQRLNFEVRSSELVGAGLKNSATARRAAQALQAAGLVNDLAVGVGKSAIGVSSLSHTVVRGILEGSKRIIAKYNAEADREMAKILIGKRATKQLPKQKAQLLPAAPALGSLGGLQDQQQ